LQLPPGGVATTILRFQPGFTAGRSLSVRYPHGSCYCLEPQWVEVPQDQPDLARGQRGGERVAVYETVRLLYDKAGRNTSISECYLTIWIITRATQRRECVMLTTRNRFVDRRPGLGTTRFVLVLQGS